MPPCSQVFYPWLFWVRLRAPFRLSPVQACVSQELLPAGPSHWSQSSLQSSLALCTEVLVFPKDVTILPHLDHIYQTALAAARMHLCLLISHPKTLLGAPAHSLFPCRNACRQTQRLSHPCLTRAPACCPYLHGQLLTTGHVEKSRSVVILIQHSDIDGSCGTAGWCSSILHNHQELVA